MYHEYTCTMTINAPCIQMYHEYKCARVQMYHEHKCTNVHQLLYKSIQNTSFALLKKILI